ncbi:MAG TPA: acetyl-CoA carboxylase biotin carboxyl carrier protein [Steroidobacteraceae bacterium]|jgi:acetyl-CoA carboxylase biotin carboxyl carrier protein|nr:acetyl-CoA carboxylase biotin carboxyl carrier protein [Steroidobacteraceae bacterium]
MLTHDDVEEILRLLDATPVEEFELETEHFKLTLRRSAAGGGWTQERETHGAAPMLAPAAPAAAAVAAPATATTAHGDAIEIRAPLVGSFYRAPKPGAAPFVEIGSLVTADTVVAIIETMKLMNSVYAGADGQVVDICIDDGGFVEQHQVLMRIRPLES